MFIMNNSLRFKKIASILKSAFINEAEIIMEVGPNQIMANLVGKFSFGKQVLGSAAYEYKDGVILHSDPGKSVWVQHKGIDSPAYRGLGYARDLMVAGISEVENNNGIVVSIGSVTKDAEEHNLKSSLAGFSTKIIVEYNEILWDDPEDLILEIPNGESFRDKVLELFSTPYINIEIGMYRKTLATSGLLISLAGAKCSLPISYRNEWSNLDERDLEIDPYNFHKKRLINNPESIDEEKNIKKELSDREEYIRSVRNIPKTQKELRSEIFNKLNILDHEILLARKNLNNDPNNNDLKDSIDRMMVEKRSLENKFYNL